MGSDIRNIIGFGVAWLPAAVPELDRRYVVQLHGRTTLVDERHVFRRKTQLQAVLAIRFS